jgi:acyl-CoA thioesterase-1
MRILAFMAMMMVLMTQSAAAQQRIVALGDSLTSGYELAGGQDFASQLESALNAAGHEVKIDNAGVSGDTTAGGLNRLEWAISGEPKPSLVIIALGANDMLRGLDPALAKDNLSKIIEEVKERDIAVLLIGMKSMLTMGPLYRGQYDKIFPALAKEHDVPLYPFFLEGVAMNPALNLDDGIHPNEKGIAVMVENILPAVTKALSQP